MFIELNLNILNNISVTISAGNDNFIAVSIEGESINWTLLHQCHMMHHYDRKKPWVFPGQGNLYKNQEILKL